MKLEQLVPHLEALLFGNGVQRAQVAGAELGERMLGIGGGTLQLAEPPAVVGHILRMLRVDGVHLSIRGTFGEERLQKELGEPVEGGRQLIGHHVEEVVGVVEGSIGIRAAAVLRQETGVFVLHRVLLSAKEEHVLAEVGEAWQVLRIAQMAWPISSSDVSISITQPTRESFEQNKYLC